MSYMSAELKLRTLAAQNAALVAALALPSPTNFGWFDRQLAQSDIGKPSDNRTCVTVRRISTQATAVANQGGPNQALRPIRFQLDVIDYNAERARYVATLVAAFMASVSLCWTGEFASPQTQPSQNPNFLLNERAGMLPQLQPPVYVETQDWRVWNVETVP